MSAFLDEATLEAAVLGVLGELGYATAHGPAIGPNGETPERATYAETFLPGRLRAAVASLNPTLPTVATDAAIKTLTRSEGGTLIEENRRFHAFLTNGVQVEYAGADGRPTHGLVRLFDFDNFERNDWLAVNQFTVAEKASGKPHPDRRPDVVVFVNGLPLAVLELKNPANKQATVQKAYQQLDTYKLGMPDLFVWNELLVVTDGHDARLGTISADWERFAPWKTIDGDGVAPETDLQYDVLLRGVFDRKRLLDIVRGFVVFDDGPNALIKKVAAYHQYHAVKKAVSKTMTAVQQPKDHRIGVVWHTQGSGKSLTMAFYAGQLVLHPELKNPTLVLLTDRNDLDGQLYGNFVACQELIRQEPVQADSTADLKERLAVAAGGVVFTTIQKFRDEVGEITTRGNVIVIADEAHRSQYGLDAKVNKAGDMTFGFARNLRVALPNAAFVGFTGTPVETTDKVTTNVFGPVIDAYDIKQAVADGATVPIYYESRLAKLKLDEVVKGELDEEFELITDDEDDAAKRKLASKWAAMEAIVGADDRVERIAADLVTHFEARTAALPGKAMVVAISRRVCVKLYREIVALRPDWHSDDDEQGAIKVVMTGQASDQTDYQPHIRTKRRLDRIAERFKKPADPLRLVIVCDMWLTGFDAPCVHTMYLDKPIKAHGLMQAIARVNRVYGAKPSGLVVDYLGLAAELKSALHTYTTSGGRGKPTFDQEEAVEVLGGKLAVVRGMLAGYDYVPCLTGTPQQRLAGVRQAADHVLHRDPAEGKTRFVKAATDLYKGYALASPAAEALAVTAEVGFVQAVRAVFAKHEPAAAARPGNLDAALAQLVSKALVSDEVIDVYSLAGLKKPDVSILNDQFLAELRNMPQRSLAAELLERLLRDEIKAGERRNLVKSEQFSHLLDESIARYQSRSVEAAQVIAEMLDLAHTIREANKKGEQLGLTPDEVAFYDALSVEDGVEAAMTTPVLCDLSRELVASIRSSVTIDWTQKESVRAAIRARIKRLLRKYKYPPGDTTEKAVEVVLKQAELLCGELAEV